LIPKTPFVLSLSKHCPPFARPAKTRRRFDRLRASGGLVSTLLLAACSNAQPRAAAVIHFPVADRPVATIVSSRWSSEPERDLRREAEAVIAAAKVRPGMSVADVGAGEGYYTIRLAKVVGAKGRVLAEDIVPSYHEALGRRVAHDRLDNVSVVLGTPDDPKLPPASFDRIFMIHMYHEIESPYAVLWHIRSALKPGGQVVLVDADRPTENHGTPPKLLACEFGAVGYRLVSQRTMPQAGGYVALFEAVGPRPAPAAIKPCPNT
jgi:ubiquinone/menaquinone biosynthesis C-methylase UbiE